MLLEGWRVELLFGEAEVLAAAKHLVDGDVVKLCPALRLSISTCSLTGIAKAEIRLENTRILHVSPRQIPCFGITGSGKAVHFTA
jgi:hypothetical protein